MKKRGHSTFFFRPGLCAGARRPILWILHFPSCREGGLNSSQRARIKRVVFFSPPVLEGRPRLPSTARVQRGPSEAARCASKEGTWPRSLLLFQLPVRFQLPWGRAPRLLLLRPSNEALLRARVPGAGEHLGVLPPPSRSCISFFSPRTIPIL